MFIINIYLRFALIGGGLILGFLFTFLNGFGFWYGFPFFLVALVLGIGYLLTGTLASSGQLLQAGDIDKAEERIKMTYFPKLLIPQYQGVYHLLLGTIASHKKDYKTAEEQLLIAEHKEYPSDNEKASVLLNLANINANKRKWPAAQTYVKKIKKLKVSEPMILEQVKQIELALKQRGNMSMRNQQMARKSGAKFHQKRR